MGPIQRITRIVARLRNQHGMSILGELQVLVSVHVFDIEDVSIPLSLLIQVNLLASGGLWDGVRDMWRVLFDIVGAAHLECDIPPWQFLLVGNNAKWTKRK